MALIICQYDCYIAVAWLLWNMYILPLKIALSLLSSYIPYHAVLLTCCYGSMTGCFIEWEHQLDVGLQDLLGNGYHQGN